MLKEYFMYRYTEDGPLYYGTVTLILYSLDEPVSKGFMPRVVATFAERMIRIVKTHEGMENLNQQVNLKHNQSICYLLCLQEFSSFWRGGIFRGVGLCLARCRGSESGHQQMRFCLGADDELVYQR